ncbi:MAG: hypothetical protein Q7J10_03140 [Methanosarcinaceae archaeon]|nr:hypothetical protein [Methanosarcinaceae archaeon]
MQGKDIFKIRSFIIWNGRVLLMKLEVKLLKIISHKRTNCGCGVAVIPVDTSPQITKMVRDIVKEYGVSFRLIDISAYPEMLDEYDLEINDLPALVVGDTRCDLENETIRRVIEEKLDILSQQ